MVVSAIDALAVVSETDSLTSHDSGAFQVTAVDAERIRTILERDYAVVWRALRRSGLDQAQADDATQKVFVTFTRRIRDVEDGRERAFLMGICHWVATNARREAARRREVPAEPLEDEPDASGNPEELLESRRRIDLVDQALEQLPADQRTVFVLFEIEGWSLAEVAENLQIPMGTVNSRLRRARERFETWILARRRHGGGR